MLRAAPFACILFFLLGSISHAQDPAGHWRGMWFDSKNGHQGPLKANIARCEDGRYHAVFSGRFFGVLPFRFKAVLAVTGIDGNSTLLAGSSNLGLIYGTITYSARVTGNCFVANFQSPRYAGRFEMSRN